MKPLTICYPIGDQIYLNLTNQCNCACDFCIRHNKDRMGDMTEDQTLWLAHEPSMGEVVAALDQVDFSNYKEAVFCGFGEPTCRLGLLLATAQEIRHRAPALPIRLNTNGLSDLMYQTNTAPLFAGLFDCISISLNASDAEKYLAVTHAQYGLPSYDAMLAFAKQVGNFVPNVVVSVVDSIGAQEVEACRARCEALGLNLRVREYEA